jgi:hypothetical protein
MLRLFVILERLLSALQKTADFWERRPLFASKPHPLAHHKAIVWGRMWGCLSAVPLTSYFILLTCHSRPARTTYFCVGVCGGFPPKANQNHPLKPSKIPIGLHRNLSVLALPFYI